MDVSICLPLYNEKEALRATILEIQETMRQLPYTFEIVIVDDGSTDDCVETIRDLDVRIIRHRRRFGGGVARVTAMRFATGNLVVQSDTDGTYPCNNFGEMIARLSNADMVIGARRSEKAKDWRWLRAFMKWMLRSVASVLVGHRIPDLNSGLRSYHRRHGLRYAHLYPKGHSIMSTMTLAFLSDGLAVDHVMVDYRERQGKSSFRPVTDTYNYMVTIVRTVVSFDPLRVLLPVAGLLGCIGCIWAARDLILTHHLGNLSPLFLMTAIMILVMAVLADQIARFSRQAARLTNQHIIEAEDLVEVPSPRESPERVSEARSSDRSGTG
jgi:glycosyltransferase involved in cell wall biosynthesis